MLENPSHYKTENLLIKKKTTESNEEEEEQYIFYNQNKKFTSKIELDVILNSNPNHRVVILIDIKSTLRFLSVKIADYMEHFPTYSNLEGLKAINFTKKSEKGTISIPIDSGGEVKDYLENGNTIYCDLKSEEYWIKTSLNLVSNDKKLSISLDIKAKVEMVMVKLKLLLVKMAINFWIDFRKKDPLHYIIIEAKLEVKNSKQCLNLEIGDLTKKSSYDDMSIKDVFDFDSEIVCSFILISLEELIFNELLKYKSNEFEDKLKFAYFQEIKFQEFFESYRLREEFNTIRRIIRKYCIRYVNIVSSPFCSIKGSIYCYEKSNKDKLKNYNGCMVFIFLIKEGSASDIIIIPNKKKSKHIHLEGSDTGSFSEPNKLFGNDYIGMEMGFNSFITINKDNFVKEFRGIHDTGEKDNKIVNTEEGKLAEFERISTKLSKHFSQENLTNSNLENLTLKFHKKKRTEEMEKEIIRNQVEEEKENPPYPKNIFFKSLIQKRNKKINSKSEINNSNLLIISHKGSSLFPDISRLVSLDKFNLLIDSNSMVKVCKVSLEKMSMPQFRSMKMNKGESDLTEIVNLNSNSKNKGLPSINEYKRVIIFVLILLVVLILMIILSFCI